MGRTKNLKRRSGSSKQAARTPLPVHELDEDRLLAELARVDYAGRVATHDAQEAVRRVVALALHHTALRLSWMARRIDDGTRLSDAVTTVFGSLRRTATSTQASASVA